jgi:helicase SWR1
MVLKSVISVDVSKCLLTAYSDPLERAIEAGDTHDDETQTRVNKLHTVLRPYLLRRLKRDVEKELPSKFEHLVLCPLSKRQRFLYDEFMSRRTTTDDLGSGVYQRIANILMQLRKVCNHPDLFEVRPIVTSFAMSRSAVADFEIKDLLIRKHLFRLHDRWNTINFDHLNLLLVDHVDAPLISALETRRLDATDHLQLINENMGHPPPKDLRTVAGCKQYRAYQERVDAVSRMAHMRYINHLRCTRTPSYGSELLTIVRSMTRTLTPLSAMDLRYNFLNIPTIIPSMIFSLSERSDQLSSVIERFAFATPPVVAVDLSLYALPNVTPAPDEWQSPELDHLLHRSAVKLQIAFPDPSLLQYDCGKLQRLHSLLRERKAGGHRVLIFTQMTKILDILETFLNFHGWLYLRLDGATKIEDRQYITERFNADPRIFCFISSSRSGGVGIKYVNS